MSEYEFYGGTPPHEAADTSYDAAERIRAQVTGFRREAFDAIAAAGEAGLTDQQGYDVTGMAENTWRPRRCELEQMNLIEEGGRRHTRSGRTAKVWVLTDLGRSWARWLETSS